MPIYIKGVEMPAEGVFCIDIFPDGRVAGHYDCTIKQAKAVPVPAHGRLIDADALIENCMKEDGFLAELLFRKVSNAPTIIPAEEGET